MKRFLKYLAGLALAIILVFVASIAVTLIFRKGDTFRPASRMRATIWLSKRIVAESVALPLKVWDPYRGSHRQARTGPSENLMPSKAHPGFTTRETLQNFFTTSADFKGATVRTFVNSSLPDAADGFSYQPADEAMLDSLAELYSLEDLIQSETGDYDVLNKTRDWLYRKFNENKARR